MSTYSKEFNVSYLLPSFIRIGSLFQSLFTYYKQKFLILLHNISVRASVTELLLTSWTYFHDFCKLLSESLDDLDLQLDPRGGAAIGFQDNVSVVT